MNNEEVEKYMNEWLEEERKKEEREKKPYMRVYTDVLKRVGLEPALLFAYYVSMVEYSIVTNEICISEKKPERFKDEKGVFCSCSYENIKQFTGLSDRKIKSAKKILIENNLIKEVRRKDKSNKTYVDMSYVH